MPKNRLITFKVPDKALIHMDYMVKHGGYSGRSEMTRDALADFISKAKAEQRSTMEDDS